MLHLQLPFLILSYNIPPREVTCVSSRGQRRHSPASYARFIPMLRETREMRVGFTSLCLAEAQHFARSIGWSCRHVFEMDSAGDGFDPANASTVPIHKHSR